MEKIGIIRDDDFFKVVLKIKQFFHHRRPNFDGMTPKSCALIILKQNLLTEINQK